MADIRTVRDMNGLITYFSENLGWNIDMSDFYDIEDISYDFSAADIGLKEEAFAKIASMRQLQPMTDDQQWGIFCIEFDSNKFEPSAMRKILSGLIPRRRNMNTPDHAIWQQQDLLFICNWGEGNNRTIGLAHFEDREKGLPQIKMISCAPALEDFTQIKNFEQSLEQLAWPEDDTNIEAWRNQWSAAFAYGYREIIQTSSALTVRLAAEAQNIRNRILDTMKVERHNGYVHLLCEKFRQTLIHDMSETAFADMYAQTVVYGLFTARCMDNTQADFSVNEAIECIPNTNPFLKNLMADCLGAAATKGMQFDELDIGNVVDLLAHTNTEAIIRDFNRQTGGGREDPVIHFYEEFLTAYDKAQKVQRGVYYTPQPVVNFIVRAVDDILKNEFGLKDGLASTETKKVKQTVEKLDSYGRLKGYKDEIQEVPAVQVLDPATGTGTFLRQVILQIYENFKQNHRGQSDAAIKAAWNEYVPKHLLPRINGFELMMAPYAVAHMKLAMVLHDTGYEFGTEARLNVCLTNTLEPAGNTSAQMSLFDDPLAMESVEASKVKKNRGISICVGNPPYSVESSNKGEWIQELLENYKREPGGIVRLEERNPKPINDDYVKFIRWAQHMIMQSGEGIMAYINPHGFIANPTFRGMRWSLLQSYDSIYVLDLHGNSNRKETCPDGSKDENVFDIQQGVSIVICVKSHKHTGQPCKVYHSDVYGTRNNKYQVLSTERLESLEFTCVTPDRPGYIYVHEDKDTKNDYEHGFGLTDLFNVGANGIKTARDKFTLADTPNELLNRMNAFREMETEQARAYYELGNDVDEWQVKWAQDDLSLHATINGKIDSKKVMPILYRVFDTKYMIYTGTSCGIIGRPRADITKHFVLGPNIGLATARSNKSTSCNHFLAVDKMIEMKCAERTTCAAVFPLYNYSLAAGQLIKGVNLNHMILDKLSSILQLPYVKTNELLSSTENFSEVDVFAYVYGILYSKKYREKYSDFLKRDFARIIYPRSKDFFFRIANLGKQLISAHLLQGQLINTSFIDNGNTRVEKAVYKDNRVYINKASYFTNVNQSDWEFMIGGYEILQYWFKSRKGQELSISDIEHYKHMIAALQETQRIMQEIDEVIEL